MTAAASSLTVELRGKRDVRASLQKAVPGAIGFASFFLMWEIIGRLGSNDGPIPKIPPFSSVISAIFDDGWTYYRPNLSTTLNYAVQGWLWGNALAILASAIVLTLPFMELPILQIGVTTYCLPIVAIAPLMFIAYTGNTPYIVITIQFVFFGTLVNTLSGLRSADPTSLDVVRAYGGGRAQGLFRVRLISALPSLFAGLKMAAPAAILGAVVAEFFNPADRGLGIGIINAQTHLQDARAWGIAVVATTIGGVAFFVIGAIARVVTPWAKVTEF